MFILLLCFEWEVWYFVLFGLKYIFVVKLELVVEFLFVALFAAIKAFVDVDDDVRGVAAEFLLFVVEYLLSYL